MFILDFNHVFFIVNDLGGSRDGTGRSAAADATVEDIRKMGGNAVADYSQFRFDFYLYCFFSPLLFCFFYFSL